MYKDLYSSEYDYVIFGTSLTECILSAYLSKSKKKILQMDISKSYGGDCKNFNLKDMEFFIKELKEEKINDSTIQSMTLEKRETKVKEPIYDNEKYREFNFDLNPKFVYAKSKSTSELIDSKASSYIEFVSVKRIFFMYMNKYLKVPFSKSEIFISEDLELLEKQKLLNFIFSIMKIKNKVDVNSTIDIKKDIELDDDSLLNDINNNLNENANEFLSKRFNSKIKSMILVILAHQTFDTKNMNVNEMCEQIYKFLISVQIYDNTPFLCPQYGSSEFSQAMSRLSSLYGTIFLVRESLKANININKEYLINNNVKKFAIEITDDENNETFIILSDNVIINNSFIDSKISRIKFNDEIQIENKCNDFIYKYTGLYIIKFIGELYSEKDGPWYFRVPKNDPELKNKYPLDCLVIFKYSSSIPKNRMMIYISVISDVNEVNENEFKNISNQLCNSFIERFMKDMRENIKNNYDNEEYKKKCSLKDVEIIEDKKKEEEKKEEEKKEEEKKEEEKKEEEKKEEEKKEEEKKEEEKKEEEKKAEEKKEEEKKEEKKGNAIYIPPKKTIPPIKPESISIIPEKIIEYEFNQKILLSDYYSSNENIIFTKTNYTSIDLDTYFLESEKIIKEKNFPSIPQEVTERRESFDNEDREENDLIDELFEEIENEKKEEENKKEEEEKKEDIK